eukprot:COSAG05_NODE_561_length_8675_cov_3.694846_3_plen_81_part_00
MLDLLKALPLVERAESPGRQLLKPAARRRYRGPSRRCLVPYLPRAQPLRALARVDVPDDTNGSETFRERAGAKVTPPHRP